MNTTKAIGNPRIVIFTPVRTIAAGIGDDEVLSQTSAAWVLTSDSAVMHMPVGTNQPSICMTSTLQQLLALGTWIPDVEILLVLAHLVNHRK
jgi:hypothetical protein